MMLKNEPYTAMIDVKNGTIIEGCTTTLIDQKDEWGIWYAENGLYKKLKIQCNNWA